jgi:predicted secreted protein
VAQASGGLPNKAYAFSAVVAKGSEPRTVSAAEHHATKSVQLTAGGTFTLGLPGNAKTGYTWASTAPIGGMCMTMVTVQ